MAVVVNLFIYLSLVIRKSKKSKLQPTNVVHEFPFMLEGVFNYNKNSNNLYIGYQITT